MNTQKLLILFLILMIGALSACADGAQTMDAGTIRGRVRNLPDGWSNRSVTLYAGKFSGSESGAGYYVLEPDQYPHAPLKGNGKFEVSAVPAGVYILLAGPSPEEALRLVDRDGTDVVIEMGVETGVDLGDVFVVE